MTRILLASASILAFAGAAAAQDDTPTGIIFGGDASFGFNSFEGLDDEDVSDSDREEEGFFYEADLEVTLRTILDNGAVAESTFTIPIADTNIGGELGIDDDFVLGLSIDGAGSIALGDVTFAAEDNFAFATMQSADFSEQDGETTVKGTGVFGNVEVSASAIVQDSDGDIPGESLGGLVDGGDPLDPTDDVFADERDFIDQISVGASGDIGRFTFSLGYQEESDVYGEEIFIDGDGDGFVDPGEITFIDDEIGDLESVEGLYDPFADNGDFNPSEQIGLSLGTNFRGFDVQFGYARNLSGADGDDSDGFDPEQTQSYGITVGVPIGPVTATAEYVFEPDAEDYGSDTEYSYAIGALYDTDRLRFEASFGEEIGEEEYDIRAVYAFSDVTAVGAGYNDDDGGFAFVRQGLGAGAFVEASYAEVDDVGFELETFGGLGTEFDDDIREGTTLRVGLEF